MPVTNLSRLVNSSVEAVSLGDCDSVDDMIYVAGICVIVFALLHCQLAANLLEVQHGRLQTWNWCLESAVRGGAGSHIPTVRQPGFTLSAFAPCSEKGCQ